LVMFLDLERSTLTLLNRSNASRAHLDLFCYACQNPLIDWQKQT